jgi:hypothetical protein
MGGQLRTLMYPVPQTSRCLIVVLERARVRVMSVSYAGVVLPSVGSTVGRYLEQAAARI